MAAALGHGIQAEAQAGPKAEVVLIRNADVLVQPEKMQEILRSMQEGE